MTAAVGSRQSAVGMAVGRWQLDDDEQRKGKGYSVKGNGDRNPGAEIGFTFYSLLPRAPVPILSEPEATGTGDSSSWKCGPRLAAKAICPAVRSTPPERRDSGGERPAVNIGLA